MRTLMFALLGSASLLAGACAAQTPTKPGQLDWPTYGGDHTGARFSGAKQITPANVGTLTPAWTFHMRPADAAPIEAGFGGPPPPGVAGGAPPSAAPAGAPTPSAAERAQASAEGVAPRRRTSRFGPSEATPVMVDGLLYMTTPYRKVVALRPETGEVAWTYDMTTPGVPSVRGVEYWPGDGKAPPAIVFGTRDAKLISLDAKTGKPTAGFGVDGIVDMRTPEVLNGTEGSLGMTSPPIVYGNLIITGSNTQEQPALGAAGDIRAWDARTGKLVWTFHTVPRAGEFGFDTWKGDSAKQRSGANGWGFMTLDETRGVVYVPLGAPAWDRYGGDRKGANLFGSSVVALNAKTGERLWHYQVVHHDIWDFDLEAPPTLFDVKKDGKTIAAVGIVSKNGLMFILDRVTGKPVYSVEERAVPKSDLPDEESWPTQPFPSAPPPISRITMTRAELADLTPEHKAFCENLVDANNINLGGPYLPTGAGRTTVNFPGTIGGANWGGGAFDPTSGYFIINTFDLGQMQSLVPNPTGPLPYRMNQPFGRFWQPTGRLPCQKPPWGKLVAVDVNKGTIAWESVLGVTDVLPEALQKTGRPSMGGPIVTAGGVIFIGGTDDARFRAFDAKTGAELWSTKLEASGHATPMTYVGKDGRQYVLIVSTGGTFLDSPLTSDAVTAFALPK
jgi:quinoprotein glucose dehydrogenase